MWRSKADVLNDLAEYSRLGSDFDDIHIVRGTGPPLPRHEDIDDELQIRFGDRYNQSSFTNNNQSNTPDLKAITEMLRMVDTFGKSDETQPAQSKESSNMVVVISKLNPDVHDFVPKSVESRHSQTQARTAVNNIETKVTSRTDPKNDPKKKVSERPKTPHEKTIDNNNSMNEHKNKQETLDLNTLEHRLKNKITSTSKPVTLEQKRDRNVAIAALMRLKAGASTPSKSSTTTLMSNSPQPKLESPNTADIYADTPKNMNPMKPVELLTPQYFAGPCCSPKVLDVDEYEHRIPEPLLEPSEVSRSSREILDPQVKESIEKVHKWLNPELESKSGPSAPHTGTVLFKKKESASVSPKSPCSVPSRKSDVEFIPPPPQEFVPSSYAEELKKKFEERLKAKEHIAKKNQPPPDKLKPLEDIGLSLNFKHRAYGNSYEI